MNVLVINAGSSSLKYQLVNVERHELLAKGICERVGSAEAFHKHGLDENEVVIDARMADHDDAMALVLDSLTEGTTKPSTPLTRSTPWATASCREASTSSVPSSSTTT